MNLQDPNVPKPALPASTTDSVLFSSPMGEEVQKLAAQLRAKEVSLWIFEDTGVQARWLAFIQAGYSALAATPPNMTAAGEILKRVDDALAARIATARANRTWQMCALCLLTLLTLMLLATGWALPKSMPAWSIVGVPLWVPVLGAAGGAVSAMVSLRQPIGILEHRSTLALTVAARPLVGAFLACVVYAATGSGLINLPAVRSPGLLQLFLIMVAGYNERLLGGLVAQAEGVLAKGPSVADQPVPAK